VIGRVLFDAARASLDCAAFSASAIHALELRRVFAPSWLFVGPANLVAQPGDWLTARLGGEPVILWRDTSGALKAFINLCPRCERALAEGEHGSAARLACPGHPHETGFTRVAQLATHRGLVFASLDTASLPFLEWLAPFAGAFDRAFGGTLEAVGGHRLSWHSPVTGSWRWSGFAEMSTADARRTLRRMPRAAGRSVGCRSWAGVHVVSQPVLRGAHREPAGLASGRAGPHRGRHLVLVAHDATPADRRRPGRATQFAWDPPAFEPGSRRALAIHHRNVERRPLAPPPVDAATIRANAPSTPGGRRSLPPPTSGRTTPTLSVRRTNPGEPRCATARSAALA
jgi:hypothetical protein